ncbi:hypothetical protein POSPLADRAFT_1168809 [Postia placenta MAD-698-R-SB12]|uniref:Fatty acid desaturase domain-containing protein n=1 Tax=Postia placenta MAD-698-R-SB12 TaxID=670580 RepID=A0A1X6N3V1_9APHY|nr:hypothetical protein POSPLADRAFT_1168809 [Postia placenta MAD-698-R-SB12]OSX63288.1 hypothetical protein POSPLADRAFT_1168809 [Postia placenta MAD-698-R-SB12]
MFSHGSEYEERLRKPFVPPTITLKEIHEAVPKHLLRKNPWLSAYYCVRDIVCCVAIFYVGFHIEDILKSDFGGLVPLTALWQVYLARTGLWLLYWWFQGLSFASFFCIAHELGHQTMFNNRYVNDTLGYFFHAFILAPFFAWKASHNAHHRTVASIERDENYVPYERSYYNLPPREKATTADYLEVLDETPILTLGRLLVMQGVGWWLYISTNAMGSKRYPKGTNHFSPYSPLFRPDQRLGIFLSDVGIIGMLSILYYCGTIYGGKAVFMYYFVPYVLCNHWYVMLTYLHHSDPTIPHYRKEEWSWVRGAAATVDRPLLGWAGRFFLHNVSHDHVAHHFFSYAPFYNQPEITKCVRSVLKEHYNYDSTNTFFALYRSFTECVFIEEDGAIVFYKNKHGHSQRDVAEMKLKEIDATWNAEEQDNGVQVIE